MVDRVIRQGRVQLAGAGSVPSINFSSNSARVLQGFAQQTQRLTNEAQNELDERAATEATTEGQMAGAAGDVELQTYDTIRGRAYNQAAITTFTTTLETNSASKLAELERLYGADPERLEKEISDYRRGTVQELSKISPAAGVAYDQRITLRAAPAVERARDNRFKLTRDQADAALIQNEIAIEAELKSVSGDLLSDNPNLSKFAGDQIAALQSEVMQVYNATDPDGRPLFSAEEKAKALSEFQAKVFETSTLSWFDNQDDKVKAYLDFTDGDFKINLKSDAPQVEIIEDLEGKIRSQPVSKGVRNKMAAAAAATDPNIALKIVSGGQPSLGQVGRRTGSGRHDHGNAGDIVLVRDGKEVRPAQDPELYERFLENSAAAGFTGIGIYPWGVHVGGGKVAAWGADKTSKSLPSNFGAAIERGRKGAKLETDATSSTIDIRKAIDPAAVARIESEMRQRISFANTLSDRERVAEERAIKDEQEFTYFNLTDRLSASPAELEEAGSSPVTMQEIRNGVDSQLLSPAQGRAMIEAVNTQAAGTTDPVVEKALIERMFNGEDVQIDIINAKGALTASDFKALLNQNRSINSSGEGEFSKPEKFYFDQLKSTLITAGAFEKFDPTSATRKSNALIEYKKRIEDNAAIEDPAKRESPETIMRDILDRSNREGVTFAQGKIATMLTPRFAVPSATDSQQIDILASKIKLSLAAKNGVISDASLKRQVKLLREWEAAQNEIARSKAN